MRFQDFGVLQRETVAGVDESLRVEMPKYGETSFFDGLKGNLVPEEDVAVLRDRGVGSLSGSGIGACQAPGREPVFRDRSLSFGIGACPLG